MQTFLFADDRPPERVHGLRGDRAERPEGRDHAPDARVGLFSGGKEKVGDTGSGGGLQDRQNGVHREIFRCGCCFNVSGLKYP